MTTMARSALFSAALLALSTGAGCKKDKKAGGGDEVLARIGDVTITVKEFQDTINSYTPYLRSKYNTTETKKKKLDEMVRFEVLALEAKNRGYDSDPMVQRALKQAVVRELLEKEIEGKVTLESITEKEMLDYYNAHPEKYNKPAQRRMSHILVKDRKLAEKVLAEAVAGAQDALKFRDLVLKHSEDPVNKSHGGDMGYFSKIEERTADETKVDDKLVLALYGLAEVGDVHKELVETPEGFHVVKFTSTRPEVHRTFEQVKSQIQSILWKDKREQAKKEFVDALKAKAKIEINEAALGEIKLPDPLPGEGGDGAPGAGPPPPPPGMTGGGAVPPPVLPFAAPAAPVKPTASGAGK